MLKDIAFTPAWRIRECIKNKELSPIEIVDEFLERMLRINPQINAYLTITEHVARAAAKKAEAEMLKGGELPPLLGIPVSVKDLYYTKGIRTTMGSLVYQDFVPDEDCAPVRRLTEAGAIIIGKTNTPEFGLSGTICGNRLGEPSRNPWNLERITGGSSGGAAAAVAAGLGPLALGSDGGGSIRIPSFYCGVYGLKPTFGRVPLNPGHPSPFACVGPITRNVRDAALMLDVMAGYDPSDPNSLREKPPCFEDALDSKLGKLRVAWSSGLGFANIDNEVANAARKAVDVFRFLGCAVEEATPASGAPMPISYILNNTNLYASYRHLLTEQADKLNPATRSYMQFGASIKGNEYVDALTALMYYRQKMDDFFEKYDLLLTPTVSCPAIPLSNDEKIWQISVTSEDIQNVKEGKRWGPRPPVILTAAFNLCGNPAASVPCGFSSDGLPIGLQIVGRRGDEVTVLQASAALEEARPWAGQIPGIAK